jgi:hypothetical protein
MSISDHAVVLSVDEKSQIQAVDRTQPGLFPMKKGRVGTMTLDYKPHPRWTFHFTPTSAFWMNGI